MNKVLFYGAYVHRGVVFAKPNGNEKVSEEAEVGFALMSDMTGVQNGPGRVMVVRNSEESMEFPWMSLERLIQIQEIRRARDPQPPDSNDSS